MSDDNEQAAALVPRAWRNHHRSSRAHEMQRDFAAIDESLVVTEWWKTDDEEPDT